jgi:hypothetical protein
MPDEPTPKRAGARRWAAIALALAAWVGQQAGLLPQWQFAVLFWVLIAVAVALILPDVKTWLLPGITAPKAWRVFQAWIARRWPDKSRVGRARIVSGEIAADLERLLDEHRRTRPSIQYPSLPPGHTPEQWMNAMEEASQPYRAHWLDLQWKYGQRRGKILAAFEELEALNLIDADRRPKFDQPVNEIIVEHVAAMFGIIAAGGDHPRV